MIVLMNLTFNDVIGKLWSPKIRDASPEEIEAVLEYARGPRRCIEFDALSSRVRYLVEALGLM